MLHLPLFLILQIDPGMKVETLLLLLLLMVEASLCYLPKMDNPLKHMHYLWGE